MTAHLPKHLLDCPLGQRAPLPEYLLEWRRLLSALDATEVAASDIMATVNAMLRPGQRTWVPLTAQRCGLTKQVFDPRTVVFLGIASDRPGMAVMWAYSLVRWQAENKQTLTLELLMNLLADQQPNANYCHDVWTSQKGHGGAQDNWFDHEEAWQ